MAKDTRTARETSATSSVTEIFTGTLASNANAYGMLMTANIKWTTQLLASTLG